MVRKQLAATASPHCDSRRRPPQPQRLSRGHDQVAEYGCPVSVCAAPASQEGLEGRGVKLLETAELGEGPLLSCWIPCSSLRPLLELVPKAPMLPALQKTHSPSSSCCLHLRMGNPGSCAPRRGSAWQGAAPPCSSEPPPAMP